MKIFPDKVMRPEFIAVLLLLESASGHGQSVTESFVDQSYVAGSTVAGQNGGNGFIGPWTEGGLAAQYDRIQPNNLSYPGVLSLGNSAASVPPSDYYSAPSRSVSIAAVDGSSIWVGYLLRKESDNTLGAPVIEDYFGLVLYGSATGESLFIGDPGESSTFALGTAGSASAGDELSTFPVEMLETVFLAAKISFKEGPDVVQLFVNPDSSKGEPTVANAIKTNLDLGNISLLGFLSGYDAVYSYDEIRVGPNFAAITGKAGSPNIGIALRADGGAEVSYDGVLESRSSVTSGSWTQVNGASPLVLPKAQLGTAAFFRARQP
jgi:hypothetical protein